jgi:hypothetical protein
MPAQSLPAADEKLADTWDDAGSGRAPGVEAQDAEVSSPEAAELAAGGGSAGRSDPASPAGAASSDEAARA